MLKKFTLTFLAGTAAFGIMMGFGFALKMAVMLAAFTAVGLFIISLFSPTVKYTLKGSLRKIENAAQLANAVEILEEKNVEMENNYFKVVVGLKHLNNQINHWRMKANSHQGSDGVKAALEDSVKRLEATRSKLSTIKDRMHSSITEHKSKVEVLKTKLLELESLKIVNSYLKDVSVGIDPNDGINNLVDEALAQEEALNEALGEFKSIPTT